VNKYQKIKSTIKQSHNLIGFNTYFHLSEYTVNLLAHENKKLNKKFKLNILSGKGNVQINLLLVNKDDENELAPFLKDLKNEFVEFNNYILKGFSNDMEVYTKKCLKEEKLPLFKDASCYIQKMNDLIPEGFKENSHLLQIVDNINKEMIEEIKNISNHISFYKKIKNKKNEVPIVKINYHKKNHFGLIILKGDPYPNIFQKVINYQVEYIYNDSSCFFEKHSFGIDVDGSIDFESKIKMLNFKYFDIVKDKDINDKYSCIKKVSLNEECNKIDLIDDSISIYKLNNDTLELFFKDNKSIDFEMDHYIAHIDGIYEIFNSYYIIKEEIDNSLIKNLLTDSEKIK